MIISLYCPACGWKEFTNNWNVDRNKDGKLYPIIVCPKCFHHLEFAYP